MVDKDTASEEGRRSLLGKVIWFCLTNKLVVALVLISVIVAGVLVAPFDWDVLGLPRSPVPVDAIPDIGENQQIVFTKWMGRSPQDVQDQITYPLTVSLLGVPGVKTVRSFSMFGFSSIYVIFKDGVDFYWSRSRLLEKLNSLPAGTLPEGVQPTLGPDATALGQVFWYTLEGRDEAGQPTGGWDLHELRTTQDWYVRYGLQSADGVSEVASVGGFVKEYQIDVDPDAMRAHGVGLDQIFRAVKMSNVDVGARTIEVNKVEYVIRGIGFIKSVSDIEKTVIKVNSNIPICIKDVAKVSLGPALRRGALDKGGAEVVGGVVVVRYGANPLEVINNVKKKIEEISPGLPKKTLPDGTVSQVNIIPFYDRTGLIQETLGTLNAAIRQQILVTIIVVLLMMMHMRSSILISGLLPLTVLMTFILMRVFHVDANIVALSGIAIAIGTIVDMGIILSENMLRHLDAADPSESRLEVIFRAAHEVGGAVLTAIATTVVGFLPVFTMTAAEGKLFKPLAWTKTFALVSSVVIALTIIPPLALVLFTWKLPHNKLRHALYLLVGIGGVLVMIFVAWWLGIVILLFGGTHFARRHIPHRFSKYAFWIPNLGAVLVVMVLLSLDWAPLGPEKGDFRNFLFVLFVIGGLLAIFRVFVRIYGPLLRWCLAHKILFLSIPLAIVLFGACVWLGFGKVFGFVPAAASAIGIKPETVKSTSLWVKATHELPGLGKEFMPPLDEGSFLLMPTTMPHASIGEALDVLQKQDMAIRAIPEVELVVGKIGRVESALDPAPISMVETVINYKSEYIVDKHGYKKRFKYDNERDIFVRDESGDMISDPAGRPFRQWRPHIKSPDDIWDEIIRAAQLPGTTSAPKLQPIETRLIMLQTGMRAPMGVKIKGPDLPTIEAVGLDIERLLKDVPSVEPSAVIADRIVGKPYIEIHIDREAIARYGVSVRKVQDVIEIALGGRRITTTVEGRERYGVRVRYMRELRDDLESLGKILVPSANGSQIPLMQLAETRYIRGPQNIKSEDTFLVGYVLFDKKPGYAEVDVVEAAEAYLKKQEVIFKEAYAEATKKAKEAGRELTEQEIAALPGLRLPENVSYTFTGSYENQVRSQKTLMLVVPIALFIIFIILYFQFKSVSTTLLVFSGIFVAWAGGFLLIWFYGQPWFLDFSIFGTNLRDLFQVHTFNLSVAVWVGFLALFGIASDDGVVMSTYLEQSFKNRKISSIADIREATVAAGLRRIRPCLMTTATTILALLPVLTSTGRGADIMVPMAIPSFGGMTIELVTLLVVPTLYCAIQEFKFKLRDTRK